MWNGRVMKLRLLAVLCSVIAVAKTCQRELFYYQITFRALRGKRQTSEPSKGRRWYWDPQYFYFHICSILYALQLQAASSWVPASFTVQGEWCCLNPQLFNIYLQSSVCGFAGCSTQHWDPASPDSCSTQGSREPAAPFARFALAHAERGGREGCLSSLFKDFALSKYHSIREEPFVLGGELCWFCLECFCTERCVRKRGRFVLFWEHSCEAECYRDLSAASHIHPLQ